MRLLLRWIDQFRQITVANLSSVAAAIVVQFEDFAAAMNTWAAKDHHADGTHKVMRIGLTRTTPAATRGRITLWWDGTNLKYEKPDGTTGTVV